mmetsp:Transcript_56120/g.121423  ORF Transcript_56120/g.121423 Transcript_56120/m.121423 type:complete len:307 (-) Transcript_56120:472-1392(-)
MLAGDARNTEGAGCGRLLHQRADPLLDLALCRDAAPSVQGASLQRPELIQPEAKDRAWLQIRANLLVHWDSVHGGAAASMSATFATAPAAATLATVDANTPRFGVRQLPGFDQGVLPADVAIAGCIEEEVEIRVHGPRAAIASPDHGVGHELMDAACLERAEDEWNGPSLVPPDMTARINRFRFRLDRHDNGYLELELSPIGEVDRSLEAIRKERLALQEGPAKFVILAHCVPIEDAEVQGVTLGITQDLGLLVPHRFQRCHPQLGVEDRRLFPRDLADTVRVGLASNVSSTQVTGPEDLHEEPRR